MLKLSTMQYWAGISPGTTAGLGTTKHWVQVWVRECSERLFANWNVQSTLSPNPQGHFFPEERKLGRDEECRPPGSEKR